MSQPEAALGKATKLFLYSFLAFLATSAAFAIVTVVAGTFGEFEAKVLITTSVIALASICSLCCSAFASRTGITWPTLAGIVLAAVASCMVALGVWAEMEQEGYWKLVAVLGFFALAAAHVLALLAVSLPRRHRWVQVVTTATLLLLAILLSAMVVGEMEDEGLFKVVAVLGILAALETLAVPILGKLAKARVGATGAAPTLQLTRREDGLYVDDAGQVFELTRRS
jgi:hypothetical protein